jgi:1,2-diacylglycerol 3-beta-glucosyltransferase
MIVIKIVLILLLVYLAMASGWLLLLTLASWTFRPKVVRNSPLIKFLVVIPAHNEALQIGSTIENIKKCDYAQELLDIAVIADNCTDETAKIAEMLGSQVFERKNEQKRGKGAALDWFLQLFGSRLEGYGGIVFIDADSCPDRLMFKALSESLSHPEVKVVQGFSGVINPYDNWRTALNCAAFNLFNHVRMAGNERLFGKAILKGLGMAFSPDLLRKYGWPAHSVVEDLEFTVMLLEQGIGVQYNPEAIIASEMAVNREQADGQRRRWEGGRFSLAKAMIPQLVQKVWQGGFTYIFVLADLLILPLALLVLFLLVSWLAAWVYMPSAIAFLIGVSIAITFYVVSGQLQKKASWRLWLYLAFFPLFLLWKIVIYCSLIVTPKSKSWHRTPRKSELK